MALIRYDLASAKSSVAKSAQEGAGEVFVRIEVETSFAEAARAAANNSITLNDAILAALRRAAQEIAAGMSR